MRQVLALHKRSTHAWYYVRVFAGMFLYLYVCTYRQGIHVQLTPRREKRTVRNDLEGITLFKPPAHAVP